VKKEKQKEKKILWAGPLGEIKTSNINCIQHLLDDPNLKDHFDDYSLKDMKKEVRKIYRYLKKLYEKYELTSKYHDISHNLVTTVTALRGFIGALKIGKRLTFEELKILMFAALFHDTGYVRKSKHSRKGDLESHSERSKEYAQDYLKQQGYSKEIIDKVHNIQGFTHYTEWKILRIKIKKEFLAKLLVGADFLQVVDLCYTENLRQLNEILCSRSKAGITAKSQKKFYKLARDTTKWIWEFLDMYYDKKEENPYRKLWRKRFKKLALNYDKYLQKEVNGDQ
jgi:hypothetical protein